MSHDAMLIRISQPYYKETMYTSSGKVKMLSGVNNLVPKLII